MSGGRHAAMRCWLLATAISLVAVLVTPVAGAAPVFEDVSEGSVFAADIDWASATGVTRGCDAGGSRFCPDAAVTRGQMAAFLVRSKGLPGGQAPGGFADVPASHRFADDIARIADAGITLGCGDGRRFCPDAAVTRGQMAAFLVRSGGLPGGQVPGGFADVPASHRFADDIARVADAGITLGCGDGRRFCPDAAVTRGQMAAFLHRMDRASGDSGRDVEPPSGQRRDEPAPERSARGALEGWGLVWSDEFEGSSLDSSVWRAYHNTYGDGNNELQCNTPGNVGVSGGTLRITAERERVSCPGGSTRGFTTGFLGTRENGVYFPRFARYEMRARVPHGQGLWPAFWLRHRDGSNVAEIDIMEYFHSQVPGRSMATLHLDGRLNLSKQAAFFEQPTLQPGWHTWAVEIDEVSEGVRFRFLLNDAVIHTYTDRQANWAKRHRGEPLFDIAVNMAVGGNWTGHPDDPLGYLRDLNRCAKWNDAGPVPNNCNKEGIRRAVFPSTYEIDYVRVYERS